MMREKAVSNVLKQPTEGTVCIALPRFSLIYDV
jgi:hypothetical protein